MIFEAIIITRNLDRSLHIVPMGFREEGNHIIIAPFKPSTTLENLRRTRQAVINMTDNVAIFAGCLTGRNTWSTCPARVVDVERLEDTLTHVELEVTRIMEDEIRPRFICTVKYQEMHGSFKGFNRAQAAVVEAAILISRLHLLPAAKVEAEIEYLKIAVDKTAGQRERQAWDWLMERIQTFRSGRTAGETV